MKSSLVFFGNEVLATGCTTSSPVLNALLAASYDIKAVVLSQGKVTSRNKSEPTVVEVAQKHGIPIITDLDEAAKLDADAGVLAAYGRILPDSILEAYPRGIINVHPSLLPKYRGPTPIEQAILDGVDETGVSIIKLINKTDAGPVYVQAAKPLNSHESKQQLADELGGLAAELLTDNIEAILAGKIQSTEQDEAAASLTKKLSKIDGDIDWSKSAEQLAREVRAYTGWPKSRANIHKHDVILTKVKPVKDQPEAQLTHETGDGWLEIQELIAPSGRKMTGPEFLRGYSK